MLSIQSSIGSHIDQEQPSLLIDASIYIFQYYFSMPDNWFSEEGYPTGAVYGYTTFLLKLLAEQKPKKIAACFDESLGTCFRNTIYPNYKISRPPADEDLKFQLEACREITELVAIYSASSKKYEADDLIGTLSKKLSRSKAPIAILTRDKDLGQLILREQDYLWDYAKNQKSYSQEIFEKFGVRPDQIIDYLALVGDAVDDIPGVPGFGPKTVAALLSHHSCIDGIFNSVDRLHELPIRGAKNLANKLHEHREQIMMARQLTAIVDDIPLDVTSSDFVWRKDYIDETQTTDFCERMGFPRLASRFGSVFGWND
ncbi:MAG: flap endonuclease [Cellvibrionaceae bacterium]